MGCCTTASKQRERRGVIRTGAMHCYRPPVGAGGTPALGYSSSSSLPKMLARATSSRSMMLKVLSAKRGLENMGLEKVALVVKAPLADTAATEPPGAHSSGEQGEEPWESFENSVSWVLWAGLRQERREGLTGLSSTTRETREQDGSSVWPRLRMWMVAAASMD